MRVRRRGNAGGPRRLLLGAPRGGAYACAVHRPSDKPRPGDDNSRALTANAAGAEFDGILAWAVSQARSADLEAIHSRIARCTPERRLPPLRIVKAPEDAAAARNELLAVLDGYLHLPDPRHVLAALACAVSVADEGRARRCGFCSSDHPPAARPRRCGSATASLPPRSTSSRLAGCCHGPRRQPRAWRRSRPGCSCGSATAASPWSRTSPPSWRPATVAAGNSCSPTCGRFTTARSTRTSPTRRPASGSLGTAG